MSDTLVIQPLPGIGDMVWHIPHIKAIAEDAKQPITLLTKPRSQADKLLSGLSCIHKILWLERAPGKHDGLTGLFKLVQMLKVEKFSTAWILHPSCRYALATWLAGISCRIGYGRGMQRYLLNPVFSLSSGQLNAHPVALAAHLLENHGLSVNYHDVFLDPNPEALSTINQSFSLYPKPWIVFGLGTSEPYKQWGAENFILLAKRLLETTECTIFLVGGHQESSLAEYISKVVDQPERVLDATQISLDKTVAVLANSLFYVGNDTGALNIAAAVGKPSLGLFIASPPLTYSPYIHALSPSKKGEGINTITVYQVWDKIQSLSPCLI